MNNVLNSVFVNLEMSKFATQMHETTKAVLDKLIPYEERYINTDIPEDRDTVLLEMKNGDEEIYTLVSQDTTVIPAIVKMSGNISLRHALVILLNSINPMPDDIAAFVSNHVDDADLIVPENEDEWNLDNIYIKPLSACRIRHAFDIRDFMNMPEQFEKNCLEGDWDKIKTCIAYLNRFRMISKTGGV